MKFSVDKAKYPNLIGKFNRLKLKKVYLPVSLLNIPINLIMNILHVNEIFSFHKKL